MCFHGCLNTKENPPWMSDTVPRMRYSGQIRKKGVSWGPTFFTLWFFIVETKVSNEIQDGLMLCWLSWKQIGKAEEVKGCQLKKQSIMVSSTFYRGCEGEVKAHMEIFNGVFSSASGCLCAWCLPTEHHSQRPGVKISQQNPRIRWREMSANRDALCSHLFRACHSPPL